MGLARRHIQRHNHNGYGLVPFSKLGGGGGLSSPHRANGNDQLQEVESETLTTELKSRPLVAYALTIAALSARSVLFGRRCGLVNNCDWMKTFQEIGSQGLGRGHDAPSGCPNRGFPQPNCTA